MKKKAIIAGVVLAVLAIVYRLFYWFPKPLVTLVNPLERSIEFEYEGEVHKYIAGFDKRVDYPSKKANSILTITTEVDNNQLVGVALSVDRGSKFVWMQKHYF